MQIADLYFNTFYNVTFLHILQMKLLLWQAIINTSVCSVISSFRNYTNTLYINNMHIIVTNVENVQFSGFYDEKNNIFVK